MAKSEEQMTDEELEIKYDGLREISDSNFEKYLNKKLKNGLKFKNGMILKKPLGYTKEFGGKEKEFGWGTWIRNKRPNVFSNLKTKYIYGLK